MSYLQLHVYSIYSLMLTISFILKYPLLKFMKKNWETSSSLHHSNFVPETLITVVKGILLMVMRQTGDFSMDKVISEEDTLVGMVTLKMDPYCT